MKKLITTALCIGLLAAAVSAEADHEQENPGTRFIPLLGYDHVSLDKQTIFTPALGLMVTQGIMEPGNVEETDKLLIVGLYKTPIFGKSLQYDYPSVYHSIDFLLDGQKGRHQYLLIFKSESDLPVAGGLSTYQGGLVYGYELVHNRNLSLVLGAGLAVGDFGMELPDGKAWPLLPVPLVRLNYKTEWFAASFEFLTNPNLGIIIAPEKRVRLTGDIRIDQFRDIRDIIFDGALHYRFFGKDHPMGDFAGISAGIKNETYGFDLENGTLDVHYYAAYGMLDLSLLKISGGYAFAGREMYEEKYKKDIGEGFFVSLQMLYQF
jgi:hypothetical protein